MSVSVTGGGGRRVISVFTVGVAVLVLCPFTAAARSERAGTRAGAAGVAGTVYGGETAQNLPVVVETSKNGRKVVKAIVAVRLTCTSGGVATLPDRYTALAVSKARKFGVSFGPETVRNDDGTTTDFEGSISGAFNKARTKVSGKWSFKLTDHDASGAVTDTCDSGSVTWSAKQ
jgi:hypothetical protein